MQIVVHVFLDRRFDFAAGRANQVDLIFMEILSWICI